MAENQARSEATLTASHDTGVEGVVEEIAALNLSKNNGGEHDKKDTVDASIELSESDPHPELSLSYPHSEHWIPCKIFVGGLAWCTESLSLREYFSRFGTVVKSMVMLDKRSGRSRGFGFVVFISDDAIDNVLSFPDHVIDDKPVEVKRALSLAVAPPAKIGRYGLPKYNRGRGRGLSRGRGRGRGRGRSYGGRDDGDERKGSRGQGQVGNRGRSRHPYRGRGRGSYSGDGSTKHISSPSFEASVDKEVFDQLAYQNYVTMQSMQQAAYMMPHQRGNVPMPYAAGGYNVPVIPYAAPYLTPPSAYFGAPTPSNAVYMPNASYPYRGDARATAPAVGYGDQTVHETASSSFADEKNN